MSCQECTLCFENYDAKHHHPITLVPCGHGCCSSCASMIKICFLCREEITSTVINRLVLEIIDEKKTAESSIWRVAGNATVPGQSPIQIGTVRLGSYPDLLIKSSKTFVAFPFSFPCIPTIVLGFSAIDADNKQNIRLHLAVESIAPTGFHILASSWADSHLYRLGINQTLNFLIISSCNI